MRILTLTLLAVLLSVTIYAQPWLENLPSGKAKKDLTLFDYQQAFESYWAPFHVDKGSYFENGVRKKAPGWKQFKRWEYEMKSLVNPATGEFPRKSAMEIRQEFEKANPRSSTTIAASWSPLGPTSSFSGYSGIGRLNCVAFHPTDVNTYWVGAAAGGLWMTTDNALTWTCLTDNNGVLAVSDIVIPADYETSNTIYIATGDRDAWDNRSIGVLKSTDRGNTWNPTGVSFTIYEGQMVNRLLMDPNNNQIIYAATTRGVYKTTDGGATWNSLLTTIEFIDMEFNPGNSSIIYASTKNGEIYLSTDGLNFGGPVYSDGNARRMELAVSPNQPGLVYAVASNGSSGLYGIFQSTDSGASFTEVFSGSTKNLLTWSSDGSGTDGQGWYDLALAASPFDANVLLVGGVNTWRSTDAGVTWSIVNHWYGDQVQAVHADKHKLAFRDNGDLFECSDGGVYLSHDNGSSWADKTNGIQISQMYRLGVSQTGPEDVITGLQDNGTKLHSGNSWFDVVGGDGMECLIDYSDVNIQYGTVYFGDLNRTTNHWLSSENITPPDDGAWVTPYIIDPANPNIIYGGYNEVWKTEDRGETWEQISFFDPNGHILSMGIAPSDSRYLYVATYNRIWRTTTGGDDWTNITNNLPTGSANIEYITVKHDDPNTVWVVLSGYSNPGVYQSTDGGVTWTSISSGLPPIPAVCVVENKQNTEAVHLYLGTELGVYFKNGDDDWVPYNTGLPNVRIGEIEIYYSGNPGESKLRAATYGRGLWETSIEYTSSPMVYVSSTSVQNNKKNVEPNQVNQEILKVEISTTGNLMPFSVSSFTFNTNGSTDPLNDITNARLFYSGASNAFSTATEFGNGAIAPNGEFTITGLQELNNGKNNFWLTYDLPATAALGHVLDAECTELTVESPRSLIVTAPEGNRKIGFEYCEAGAAQMTYEYISNFKMGSVNQHSDKGSGGYQDFTAEIVDMVIGEELEFVVENGVPYVSDEVLVWVDWNIDGDFDDEDEIVFASGPSGDKYFPGVFTPPAHARTDVTRMRVRLHDKDNGPNETPCGYGTWGEVEDYSVRVSPPGPCNDLNYFAHKAQSIPSFYVDLGSDGTVIPTREFDNANSDPQDIGFPFVYNCDTFTQFVLNTNGFIKLGDTPPSDTALFYEDPRVAEGGIFGNNNPADVNLLSPFNIDLGAGTGIPEYRVHTSGVSPNRICTIQYKNVREANSNPIPQFDNMEFQIKLYETSHVIEFVYGDWTRSGNTPDLRPAACGLKGSSSADNQLLLVSKRQEDFWKNVSFANQNIPFESAIFYQDPPNSPEPDKGRKFRFVPRYIDDLAVKEIYSMAEASIYYSSPQIIGVNIENGGWNTLENIPVTLSISGANTFSDTQYISTLGPDENITIYFSEFIPTADGTNDIVASIPADDNILNNSKLWTQSINDFNCNYAYDEDYNSVWEVVEDQDTVFYTKYKVTGTAQVQAVTAYVYYNAYVGETAYGVVLDHDGNIIGQSDPIDLLNDQLGIWVTFPINNPPTVTNDYFYAGFAVPDPKSTYFLLGVQNENPVRPETYYTSNIDADTLIPTSSPYRLMIGATLAPTPPVPGTVFGFSSLCSGEYGVIAVAEYSGFIQWQESPDGVTNWVNVTSGSGANSHAYQTPELDETTYYRVEVTQPSFSPVYSNIHEVIVHKTPGPAEEIVGDTVVCQGELNVLYTVEEIPNAASYGWIVDGAAGSSDSSSILIDYSNSSPSALIIVVGFNEGCIGVGSLVTVDVFPTPATPLITYNESEQSLHSDSPTGNQWHDQNGPIPGATSQNYNVVADGDYYTIVTNGECSSEPSNVIQVLVSSIEIDGSVYSVKVNPNPVKDQMIIEISGNTMLIPFEIHNSSGQILMKGEISDRKLVQTEILVPGVYFLHVKDHGTGEIIKFVKE